MSEEKSRVGKKAGKEYIQRERFTGGAEGSCGLDGGGARPQRGSGEVRDPDDGEGGTRQDGGRRRD